MSNPVYPSFSLGVHSGFHPGLGTRARVLRLGLFLGPALGVALGGCTSSGSSGDMAMPVGDLVVANDQSAPNPDALTTAYNSQFIGYWGIKAKSASIQTLPFFGDTANTNTTLSVGEFRLDGMNNLVMDQKECRVTVASAKDFIKTTVPDKIADSVPVLTGAVQVYGMAGFLGFRRAQVAIGIGCNLADPFNDPLPMAPGDAKVVDQDADGKPGVTAMPETPVAGSVYVAQRRKYSYTNGLQASQSRLTGTILDRSEQYILDAVPATLNSQVPSRPVDEMSVFEMVKLPSQYTCTQLKAEADTLFTLK